MAAINNFSLVGIGSSVKLGKGGIVLAQSGGKLTVDTAALATETYVTTQGFLTDATAASAGYLKQSDIDSLNYVDSTELATALADYTTTAELTTYGITDGGSLDTDVTNLGFIKTADLSGYLQSSDIDSTVQGWDADLDAIAALAGTSGILTKTAANTWSLDTNTYLTTGDASSTYAPINNPTFTGTVTLAADPVAALQAATKQYVDGIAAGLTFKAAVRVATTANVGTYSSGEITGAPDTVDGVTLVAGDRILVKAQSAGLENGIYSVTTVGTGANGVWDRAADFDEPSEVNGGTFVFVTEGSTMADKGFVLISNNPITLGTDALDWSQYSSTGTVSVAAGTGIDVSESLGAYTVSLADISGVSGSYGSTSKTITLTVDGQGRITDIADTDIAIDWTAVSGTPTTLSGYGITDGLSTATTFGGDVSGTYNSITLASVGTPVTASFVKITTDTKGRVTATTAVTTTDINTLYGYTPVDPGSLATVATTGAYSDLTGTPDLSVYLEKDGSVAMTGDLDLGTHKIVNVVDPTANQDAATKKYVDDSIASVAAGSTLTVKAAFSQSVTSGDILAAMPSGATITKLTVKVTTAFDGTSPIIAVTQDGNTVDDGTGSDLATTGIYIIDTYFDTTAATTGNLSFAVTIGGSTVGAGVVYAEYVL